MRASNELHAEAPRREIADESKGYAPIGCEDGSGACIRLPVLISLVALCALIAFIVWGQV